MRRKSLYLPDELAEAIATYRFNQRIESENQAVVDLIQAGLSAKKRETSPRLSSLGSKYLKMRLPELNERFADNPVGLLTDIRSLAGSVVSQDETRGQG